MLNYTSPKGETQERCLVVLGQAESSQVFLVLDRLKVSTVDTHMSDRVGIIDVLSLLKREFAAKEILLRARYGGMCALEFGRLKQRQHMFKASQSCGETLYQ